MDYNTSIIILSFIQSMPLPFDVYKLGMLLLFVKALRLTLPLRLIFSNASQFFYVYVSCLEPHRQFKGFYIYVHACIHAYTCRLWCMEGGGQHVCE